MQAALNSPSDQTILEPAGLTIGRIQSNQYVVYDRRVSARHAVISFLKPGYFTITDIGSTNGTFVNGLLLTHNVPHILHAGDTICIGDTLLTFQIIDQFPLLPNDISSLTQKVDEIPTLALVHETHQSVVSPSTRSHRKIQISILLVGLLLLGVIAISSFEYLNRSTPDTTLDIFCKALQSKDYLSYDQLSIKLQGHSSEKLIADNLSNVKDCTYQISKQSENFVAAKLTFIGLSGQLVSGTMILNKDSNNTWKVDDLQNI